VSLAVARKPVPSGPLDVAAFVSDAATRDALNCALRESNLSATSVVEGGIAAALKDVEPGAIPHILIVDISASATPVADVAALAAVIEPGTKLIVIGAANDVTLFRDLLGVGAADYLVKPLDPQMLHNALQDGHGASPKAGRAPGRLGRVALFVGTRGGVGATTVAVNAAWLVAHDHRHKTALVDLDLHFGTAMLSLDLEPGRGLRDALEHPGRVDSLFMDRAMVKASDRLSVLGGEEPLRENAHIDPSAVEILLNELRQNFEWVMIDMPRPVLLAHAHALTVASDIVLICEQSLAGVRDTMRILDVIKETAPQLQVRLATVQQAGGGKPKIPKADFERSVGRKLDYEIPFNAKAVAAGSNAGKPLTAVARSSPLVKTLRQVAVDLAGNKQRKSTGFFSRWIKR
jgi:pilus assembly protein CpaE